MSFIVAGVLNSINKLPKVMITGGSGRVGKEITKQLSSSGHSVISLASKDMPLTNSRAVSEKIKEIKPDLIIHGAAVSSGSSDFMHQVNVGGTDNIIQGAGDTPIIYLSSTVAYYQGLTKEVTPYAHSKQIAANLVKESKNSTILKLCSLVGDKESMVYSIADLAGIPGVVRMNLRKDSTIQPLSYESLALTVDKLVQKKLNETAKTEVFNAVGEPISINNFLKSINPTAKFSLQVGMDHLKPICKEVDAGILTPEFLELAELPHYGVKSTHELKELLGENFPKVEDTINVAKSAVSLGRKLKLVSGVVKPLMKNPSKELVKAMFNSAMDSSVKIAN